MKTLCVLIPIVLLAGIGSAVPNHQVPILVSAPQQYAPLQSAENAQLIQNGYIVVLKKGISEDDLEAHHNFLLQTLIARGGLVSGDADGSNELKHVYEMPTLKGYAGTFTEAAIEEIRRHPQVDFVERDQTVYATELQRNAPWGLSRLSHREPLTFRTYNKYPYDVRAGAGVTTYVIDTGINIKHVDFGGRASWGITVPEGDEDKDGNGHGTHVAGTMVGSRYGVAKNATVVAVKVLRSNGSGSMSDVVRGVEYVAEAHQLALKSNKKTASVANMSLGGGYSRALNMAVDGAVEAGVHFAVAAGNDDSDACGYSPASAENAISVGATTIDDERAWFSNKGKCVDVFAPGKDITSTWIGSPTATNTISGTSMASPHVAGLLAYMLSLEDDPSSVSPKDLKQRLVDASTKDVLTKVPKDTVNKLIFSNPPDEVKVNDDGAALMKLALEEMEDMLLLSMLEMEMLAEGVTDTNVITVTETVDDSEDDADLSELLAALFV